MPADPGRQRGHRGVVQVERAAVGGVWVQSAQRRLPYLGRKEEFKDKELYKTFLSVSLPVYLGTF